MWKMLWPALLIVLSNTFYNIAAKATPRQANPFLSLTVTYLVGASAAFALFLALSPDRSVAAGLQKLNGTSLLLGVAIVGLEVGYLYFYRAGWDISVGPLVVNIALAVVLLLLGTLCYHEGVTLRQAAGIALCLAGMVLINLK